MQGWLWIVAALVLFALEALTPGGFFLVFFAAGALLVGALATVGVVESLSEQILVFSASSVVLLLAFRSRLVAWMRPGTHQVDSVVGESGVLLDDLAPGAVAKVEVRGSAWNARTHGTPLLRGQRCRVARVDGLTLWVEAE